MKRIYVAGALNAGAVEYIKNLHKMIVWGDRVRRLGFAVFIPGIDFLMGVTLGNWEYQDYFKNNQSWLKVADALFVVPGSDDSDGTKKEIEQANSLDIPVYYSLDALVSGEIN